MGNRYYPAKTAWLMLLLIILSGAAIGDAPEPVEKGIFDLSLEELMDMEIKPTATLTRTTVRNRPAAVTIITKEDIVSSSARSLDELLDLYVPNFQMLLHNFENQHIGVRGNLFDRDDKYLLLVNGRIMNERGHYGAISERDLPMLRDIQRVEVVRGPGSVLYGPGALTMVINIITENSQTFQGTEITSRLGSIDEFYTTEVKWGKIFKDKSGLYIYAGAAEQPGAKPEYSGYTPSVNYNPVFGSGYTPDQYTDGYRPHETPNLPNYRQSFRDLVKLKFHAVYTKEDFEVWTRYTRGGNTFAVQTADGVRWDDMYVEDPGVGYQQLTLFAGNTWRLSEEFDVRYSLSYDMLDYDRVIGRGNRVHSAYREDEFHSKVVARWNPAEEHSLAFGSEWSHEIFGIDGLGWPDIDSNLIANEGPWHTDTYSLFGEYQWQFLPKWTLFLGSRVDWHTFTDPMFSPRLALVNQASDKDTFKYILQRSVRSNTAEDMKKTYNSGLGRSEFETFDSFEARWERQHSKNLWLAVSGFCSDHEALAYKDSTVGIQPIGNIKMAGVEIEAAWKTEMTKIAVSHGYTKLVDFRAAEGVTSSYISSEPFGYGDDLANWHNHVSKLTVDHKLTEKLTFNGALNVYWGLPSGEAFYDYNYEQFAYPNNTYRDWFRRSYDDAAGPSIHLNLGFAYDVTENLNIRVMGYDLLGLFDEKLNKRNELVSPLSHRDPCAWREEPVSLSFTMTYKF
jgi:iron complex outermembrane receptor protein